MSYYTSDLKYVKQYIEYEFPFCNIDELMQFVGEYPYKIHIEVENDEWIRGDEDLMDFIQLKLIPTSSLKKELPSSSQQGVFAETG